MIFWRNEILSKAGMLWQKDNADVKFLFQWKCLSNKEKLQTYCRGQISEIKRQIKILEYTYVILRASVE